MSPGGQLLPPEAVSPERRHRGFSPSLWHALLHRLTAVQRGKGLDKGGVPWGLSWRLLPQVSFYSTTGSFDPFTCYRHRCFSISLALSSNLLSSSMTLTMSHDHNWITIVITKVSCFYIAPYSEKINIFWLRKQLCKGSS